MNTKFSLISISLPNLLAREEIETRLDCVLKKRIEKTFYTVFEEAYIVYTQFNVLTFINFPREEIVSSLLKLDVKNAHTFEQHYIYQDYPILIDPNLELTCKVSNDTIILKEASALSFIIIALVISQSVGLEKYEQDLDVHFRQSRQLLDFTNSHSLLKRSKLAQFAKNLTFIRHGMLSDLFLLDKPNILWDNEEAEHLYNLLAAILELKDRFDIVAFKLNNLKDDIGRALDLMNQAHSEFLEWIIILLIGAEITVMLIDFFK